MKERCSNSTRDTQLPCLLVCSRRSAEGNVSCETVERELTCGPHTTATLAFNNKCGTSRLSHCGSTIISASSPAKNCDPLPARMLASIPDLRFPDLKYDLAPSSFSRDKYSIAGPFRPFTRDPNASTACLNTGSFASSSTKMRY